MLRHRVEMIGVRGALKLAEFRPALMDNAEIIARYEANRPREREGVDLSKVVLTHHRLTSKGEAHLRLGGDDPENLKPMTASGSGLVQDKEKALLAEIIERVNELFEGVSEADEVVYVRNVIRAKLMEDQRLADQARNNSREQFAASPDLRDAIVNAVIDAYAAHEMMSRQALNSDRVRDGLREILLGPGRLWEMLRENPGQDA